MVTRCTACGRLPNEPCCGRCHGAAWSTTDRIDIRARREAAGMSRRQLAKAVGVHFSSIYNWETYSVALGPDTRRRLDEVLR